MIEERKNVQTTPTRTYCKCSRPLPYCNPIVGRTGTGSLPSTIAPPDHPPLTRKRSVVQIKNSGNCCLAAAVGVAFAFGNTVSTEEWRELIKDDRNLSTEQLLLKYINCPTWYKKVVARIVNRQNDLATLLCREANVVCWRSLTICDLSKFEDILSVDILVISSR